MRTVAYGNLNKITLGRKKRKTKVCIIFTGGTIGMIPENPENPNVKKLKPASLDELLHSVPNLGQDEGIELGMVSFKDPVDSSDIMAVHWVSMAKIIREYYDEYDGFVILHGTDTMAYTTSALSFILNNLQKPVVVTGSQLPITNPRTDAVQNLVNSVQIAGYKAFRDIPKIPEVLLCFRDKIIRGNRATKYSSSGFVGFQSPNYPSLGKLGEHIIIREELILENNNKDADFFITDITETTKNDIKVIPVNPGITPEKLDRDLRTDDIDGVILLTYGTGNMQTSQDFIDVISEAVKGGEGYIKPIPVLNVTQCLQGTVEMGLYEASSGLLEAGVTSGLDLTLEAALGKISWALSRFGNIQDVHNQLQFSQRGEQSKNLHEIKWKDKSDIESNKKDSNRIITKGKMIPGRYVAAKFNSALMRIQGLHIETIKKEEPIKIKIFVNNPNATITTSDQSAEFVYSIHNINQINENGNLVFDATKTSKNVIQAGNPVSISLVGENCSIQFRSIFYSLYTDAD